MAELSASESDAVRNPFEDAPSAPLPFITWFIFLLLQIGLGKKGFVMVRNMQKMMSAAIRQMDEPDQAEFNRRFDVQRFDQIEPHLQKAQRAHNYMIFNIAAAAVSGATGAAVNMQNPSLEILPLPQLVTVSFVYATGVCLINKMNALGSAITVSKEASHVFRDIMQERLALAKTRLARSKLNVRLAKLQPLRVIQPSRTP